MRFLSPALAALLIAGCQTATSTATPDKVFVRTDGQTIWGDRALELEFEAARTACHGQVQAANLSAPSLQQMPLAAAVVESSGRRQQSTAVAFGCMADRGYLYVPVTTPEGAAAQAAWERTRSQPS